MNLAPRVVDYMDHILRAIERVDRYTINLDEIAFLSSEIVQDAVIRNIEVIGEASNNILRLAPELAAQQGQIPWLVLYTMRNRIAHGYDKVDLQIVWKTIKGDMPGLHAEISRLRESISDSTQEHSD